MVSWRGMGWLPIPSTPERLLWPMSLCVANLLRIYAPFVHEPGAGLGETWPGRSPNRRLLPGCDPLRTVDRSAGHRRRGPPRAPGQGRQRGAAVAAFAQPAGASRFGDGGPQGDRQGAVRALHHGPGVGRRPAAVPGGPADPGAATLAGAAAAEVGVAASGGRPGG